MCVGAQGRRCDWNGSVNTSFFTGSHKKREWLSRIDVYGDARIRALVNGAVCSHEGTYDSRKETMGLLLII